jgi:hypothetical protein
MALPENAGVLALYALLSIGLLSPIASNSVLPEALDHANHTALIVQAKQALDEGQFPLRVTPFQQEGLRYPIFQFYSHTPYLFGGLLYKYVTPDNPWMALKIIYFAGLWSAAVFTFKTGRLLGFDKAISVLMGVVYITAPYLLVNIHARGAYTEAFAQFLIPTLAYTSIRLVKHSTALAYLWTSLVWLLFGTSHIITFAFGTLYYVALVSMLYVWRKVTRRDAVSLLCAAALGWLVSAFQWYPAATIRPLQIHSDLGHLFRARWLTPLATLLSLSSTPPEPLGGLNTAFLHASIGIPILIAVAGLIYFSRRLGPESGGVGPLLILFGVAFLCSWSPVDFWALLPKSVNVAQFPYRFLTYVVCSGTVLFGYFMSEYRRLVGPISLLGWLAILILLTQPYLPVLQRNTRTLASIVANPDQGYGAGAYMYTGQIPSTLAHYRGKYETELPWTSGDGWLIVGEELALARDYVESAQPVLTLQATAAASTLPCDTLELRLDDTVVATRRISPGPFEWSVPASAFQNLRRPVGQLMFVSSCGFVPHLIDPHSADKRTLWLRVSSLRFKSPGGDASLLLKDVRPHCTVVGASVSCGLEVSGASLAQLPVLYYPSLLRILVNGRPVSYSPSSYGQLTLAEVSLAPRRNEITAQFTGSRPANFASVLGFVAVVGTILVRRLRLYRALRLKEGG